jgi:hypothetical protein
MNDKPKVHVLTAGGAGSSKPIRGTNKRSKAKSQLSSDIVEHVSQGNVAKLENIDHLMPQKSDQLEYEPHDADADVEDIALNDEAADTANRNKSNGPRARYSDHESSKSSGRSFPLTKASTGSGTAGSSDVIWLVVCFFGIMASFVCYGLLLEYTTSGGRKLHELSFLFVTSGLYTVTAAAGRYVRDETPTTIPPRQFALLGLTSMGSTWCSVRSLR